MTPLVTHWRLWWRRWSTWLAGLFALATGTVTANPGVLLGFVGYFPAEYRTHLAFGVAFMVFVAPVLIAHLKQPKLADKAAKLKETGS